MTWPFHGSGTYRFVRKNLESISFKENILEDFPTIVPNDQVLSCVFHFFYLPSSKTLGIQSPSENGNVVMEPKYLAFRRWLETPCSSSDVRWADRIPRESSQNWTFEALAQEAKDAKVRIAGIACLLGPGCCTQQKQRSNAWECLIGCPCLKMTSLWVKLNEAKCHDEQWWLVCLFCFVGVANYWSQ